MMKIHLIQSLLAKLKSPKQTTSRSSAFPAVLEAAQLKEPAKQTNTEKFAEPPVNKPAVFVLARHSIRHDSIQGNLKQKSSQPEARASAPAEVVAKAGAASKRKNATANLVSLGQTVTTPFVQVEARGVVKGHGEVSASSQLVTPSSSSSKVKQVDSLSQHPVSRRTSVTSAAMVTSPVANRQQAIPAEAGSSVKAVLKGEPAPEAPRRLEDRVEGVKPEAKLASTVERVNTGPIKSTDRRVGVLPAPVPKKTSDIQKGHFSFAKESVLAKPVSQAVSNVPESRTPLRNARPTFSGTKTSGQVVRESLPTTPTVNSVKADLPSENNVVHAARVSVEQSRVKSATDTYLEPDVRKTDSSKSPRQSSPFLISKISSELSNDTRTGTPAIGATATSERIFTAVQSSESVTPQTGRVPGTRFEARKESTQGEPARPSPQPSISTRSGRTAPMMAQTDLRTRAESSPVPMSSSTVKSERSTVEMSASAPAASSKATQVRQNNIPISIETRARAAESLHVHREPIAQVGEPPQDPIQSLKPSDSKQATSVEAAATREAGFTTVERIIQPAPEPRITSAADTHVKPLVSELRAIVKQSPQNSSESAREHSVSSQLKSNPAPALWRNIEVEQKTETRPTQTAPSQPQVTSTKSVKADINVVPAMHKSGEGPTRQTHQGMASSIDKNATEPPVALPNANRPSATAQPSKSIPTGRNTANADPISRTATRALTNDTIVKAEPSAQTSAPRSDKEPVFTSSGLRVRVPEIIKEVNKQNETRAHLEIPRDVKPLIPLQKSVDGFAASVTAQTEAPRSVVNAATASEKTVSAPQSREAIPVVMKESLSRLAETPSEIKTEAQKSEILHDSAKYNEQIVPTVERVERKSEPQRAEPMRSFAARETVKVGPALTKTSEAVKTEIVAPLIQRNDSSPRSVQMSASTPAMDWNAVKPVETFASRDFERQQGDTPLQETHIAERVPTETTRAEASRSESTSSESAKVTQSSEPIRESVSAPKPELQHMTKSALPWREIQARVEQALEQSRKRIVEPDHLNLSFFTHELGTFEIDIVREKDMLSIRVGGESKVVTMMEEEKIQLVQWMREQGYQVERVEFSSKGETASAFHRESPQQNQERSEQLARGSALTTNSTVGGQAETNVGHDVPKPQVFGQRVWTA